MSWSYRKRIKIAPGVNLNIGKSGVSTSVGPRGAKVSISNRGTYVSTSIPGTGIYSRQKIAGGKTNNISTPNLSSSENQTSSKHSGFLWFIIFVLVSGVVTYTTRKEFDVMTTLLSILVGFLLWICFIGIASALKKNGNVTENIVADSTNIAEIKDKDPATSVIEKSNRTIEEVASYVISVQSDINVADIQRQFQIGWKQASTLLDQLVDLNILSKNDTSSYSVICKSPEDAEILLKGYEKKNL